jgi:hypothetical protein
MDGLVSTGKRISLHNIINILKIHVDKRNKKPALLSLLPL